mmetsp:Transcript_25874/g.60056  ORF Transcript_25874/g.60056 Transcript_25874/m.60056 type:complete len:200 (+) Transcript_25874:501-1100(+)
MMRPWGKTRPLWGGACCGRCRSRAACRRAVRPSSPRRPPPPGPRSCCTASRSSPSSSGACAHPPSASSASPPSPSAAPRNPSPNRAPPSSPRVAAPPHPPVRPLSVRGHRGGRGRRQAHGPPQAARLILCAPVALFPAWLLHVYVRCCCARTLALHRGIRNPDMRARGRAAHPRRHPRTGVTLYPSSSGGLFLSPPPGQ